MPTHVSGIVAGSVAIAGLCIFGLGVFYLRAHSFCAAGEDPVICFRSWLSAVGPLVAAIAVLVALLQLSLARDTSQRQIRAYIGIQDASIQLVNIGPVPGPQGLKVFIKFKNSGSSSANKFTTFVSVRILAEGDPTIFAERDPALPRGSSSIVFKDGDANSDTIIAVSPQELIDIRQGSKRIYVWGSAEYEDVFGTKRFFKFFDANSPELHLNSGTWGLQPHSKGYEAN